MSERTSIGQVRSFLRILTGFITVVWRHVVRFGLAYGFLGGVIGTLVVLASVIWYGFLAYPMPWKVIDPESRRFNVEEFKFTDYSSDRELNEALVRMFPVGTDKLAVDHILVDRAGANIEEAIRRPKSPDDPKHTRYYYTYRNLRSLVAEVFSFMPEGEFSWKITVVYDENDHLKQITVI